MGAEQGPDDVGVQCGERRGGPEVAAAAPERHSYTDIYIVVSVTVQDFNINLLTTFGLSQQTWKREQGMLTLYRRAAAVTAAAVPEQRR